jgi:uncharacterized protein YegP (UPF0339 family)
LGGIYREYVDEPSDPTDVYGYWLYLFAYLLGLAGFVVYLVGARLLPEAILTVREATAVLVGVGALLLLFGIVLQLPITRFGIALSVGGTVVGLAAIVGFVTVYPRGWGTSGVGASSLVIFLYGVGFLMVSGVTVLVPVATGKRGLFSESVSRATSSVTPGTGRTEEVSIGTDAADAPADAASADETAAEAGTEGETGRASEAEGEDDQSAPTAGDVDDGADTAGVSASLVDGTGVFAGTTSQGAVFAMFRRNGEWTWWLVELAALADSARQFDGKAAVQQSVADVRERVAAAGLLEIRHAAFRIYHEDDGWRWWLVGEDGSVMAESDRRFTERSDAEDAVSLVKEEGSTATVVDIDGAAFSVSESGDGWTWTLVDEAREALAVDREAYDSREDADAAVETARTAMGRAALVDLRNGGFEVFQADDDGDWRWRFVDATDTPTVEGVPAYGSHDAVESAVESLRDALVEPAVTNGTVPTFELHADDGGWGWRLVDANERIRALQADSLGDVDATTTQVDRVRSTYASAAVFDLEDAAFEVYPVDGGWRWRLVDTGRTTVATSTDQYEDREACEAAVDRVRGLVEDADLLEFENAAFQLYEDAGNWRWRLIEEDGHVIADSGDEYTSRGDAASAIPRLKQNVPNAELLEVENAAFEIYREDDGEDWRWRLIDETGANLATSGDAHPSRPAARNALTPMRSHGPTAPTWAVDDPFVQVFEGDERWHWRYVDTDGAVLGREAAAFESRDATHAAVEDVQAMVADSAAAVVGEVFVQVDRQGDRWLWRLRDRSRDVLGRTTRSHDAEDAARDDATAFVDAAPQATVFDLEQPVFRLDSTDEGWRWRLLTADRDVLAESPDAYASRDEAGSAVRETRRLVTDAETVESGPVSYELVQEDAGWRWRLVAEDGVVAHDADVHGTREAAERALGTVKGVVGQASILEIENAAFELHEGTAGWHWRLIDESGETVARSTAEYETRRSARQSLESVKQHAPSAGETIDG